MTVFTPIHRRAWTLLGVIAAIIATITALESPARWDHMAIAFGVLWMVVGLRNEFRIDPERRQFRRLVGIWPFVSFRRGSLDELSHVMVDVLTVHTRVDPIGQAQAQVQYAVKLLAKEGGSDMSHILYSGPSFEEASRRAHRAAEASGVPVIEGRELRSQRPQLGHAAYDGLITDRIGDQASLVARLRR